MFHRITVFSEGSFIRNLCLIRDDYTVLIIASQTRLLFMYLCALYTVGAKEIFTLLKRRKKITAKQGIKFHIPLSLLSVGRV